MSAVKPPSRSAEADPVAPRLDGVPSGARPGSGPRTRAVPDGDDRERLVCPDCGFIVYDNPRIIVGSVCVYEDKVLLVRRAIQPRKGYWCLPSGFMELGEDTRTGAARELWEEARGRADLTDLLAVYNIPRIGQVHLIYRGRLLSPDVSPGPESLEVRLFDWDALPRADFAYPNVHWALDHYREVEGEVSIAPRVTPEGFV